MAAAPNLPVPETATHTITIDNTFNPTPKGIIVQEGDTVNFLNNSGYDITIQFQSNPPGAAVCSNMSLPVSNGSSNGFTAPNYDAAANYYVYQGMLPKSGPFVVQVGGGPMYVHISQSGGVVTCTPDKVAVPLGNTASGLGELEMMSDVPSTSFPISWTNNNDPFNPAIQSTDGSPHPVGASAGTGDYTYSAGPSFTGVGGGGKVIIRGT